MIPTAITYMYHYGGDDGGSQSFVQLSVLHLLILHHFSHHQLTIVNSVIRYGWQTAIKQRDHKGTPQNPH